jgi:hypothetical protein
LIAEEAQPMRLLFERDRELARIVAAVRLESSHA